MDTDTYLRRIGFRGIAGADRKTLVELHRAHLLAVPFENLDIALGRAIELSLEAIFDKVAARRRGGFCYELNGLFCWLLRQLGFSVEMLSARVVSGDGIGPEFDHMALRVQLDEPWLADVGFGDSFLVPLRLVPGSVDLQQGWEYGLGSEDGTWTLRRREPGSPWQDQYLFDETPRRLGDFAAMCRFHQTSPESHFTRKSVCSRATADGRVTLSGDRLISTSGGGREERRIRGPEHYRQLTRDLMGFDLEAGMAVWRLLPAPSSG